MSDISAASATPSALRAQSFQNAMSPANPVDVYPPMKSVMKNAANNVYIVALCAGIIVAILLLIFKPPLVQTKPKNTLEQPSVNVGKVLLWSLISGLAVLAVPPSVQFISSKLKKNKK